MSIQFVYKEDEWGKIFKSIKLYLQHCHEIYIKICKYDSKNRTAPCDVPKDDDIVVIPLFEKDGSEIKSNGLDIVKYLREKSGYKFNTIFFVLSKQDIPDYVHPEKDIHYYVKSLLGTPKVEDKDVDKAVFFGEISYKNKKKEPQDEKTFYDDIEYTNIINFQEHDALTRLARLIKETKKCSWEKLRKLYYGIFVTYYADLNSEKFEILEKAQKIYNKLNDIQSSPHSDKYELFKAPIPFPLQELIDARDEIVKSLGGQIEGDKIISSDKKLTLLLVDNKTDKFKKQTKPTIIEALEAVGIDGLFDIEMIGIEKHNSENFNPDYEKFQFQKFRDEKELENLDEKEYYQNVIEKYKYKKGLVKTYSELIYNKIRSFHFIFLDFFLNGENTYLAFDFIKDIAKIKNEKQDSSTTWYFITSAVYSSVVNYSQSGLLAEYYESAVVNAGDDPTNEKRQIIFIYKLLTFINSRFKSFLGYRDVILGSALFNCKENKDKKKCRDCLEFVQSLCRKYVAEYEEIESLVAKKAEEKEFKKNVELIDSIITHFIWLPEADWPMIQRQIELLDHRMNTTGQGQKICCEYISREIKKRSDVY